MALVARASFGLVAGFPFGMLDGISFRSNVLIEAVEELAE